MCSCNCIDVFRFDNSYSWFHSKQLSYSVELINANEIESAGTVATSNETSNKEEEEEFEEAEEAIDVGEDTSLKQADETSNKSAIKDDSVINSLAANCDELNIAQGDIAKVK